MKISENVSILSVLVGDFLFFECPSLDNFCCVPFACFFVVVSVVAVASAAAALVVVVFCCFFFLFLLPFVLLI